MSDESKVPGAAIAEWFGARFAALHPQLQALHRNGGTLAGAVQLRFGSGLAGLVGRRIAHQLGMPDSAGSYPFAVDIRHEGHTLHWDRRIGAGQWMRSQFEAIGHWPNGCWVERTGPLALRLTVDVVDGAWHWRLLGAHWAGVPIPIALMPRTRAHKRIENDRYRFDVAIALPLLGEVLAYGGDLELTPRQP